MAEMIFGCPHCGQAIQCDSQYAGQTVACPYCQGGIIVPAEVPVASGQETVVSDQSPVISEQETVSSEEPVAPEPEPVAESVSEPAPEPEPAAEPEPSEPEPAAAPESSEPAPAPDSKPKQPRLPAPGSKLGGKKMLGGNKVGSGKFITKKSGITPGSIKPKPTPAPQPTPEAAAGAPGEVSQEAAGEIPPKATGWSWAAFLWGPIWAIGNKVWWGLLTILPGIGLIFGILLAIKGKKQAWQKGKWRDIDHFVKVQKRWVLLWLILFLLNVVTSVALVVLGPGKAIFDLLKGGAPGGEMIEEVTPGDVPATQPENVSSEDATSVSVPSEDAVPSDTSSADVPSEAAPTPDVSSETPSVGSEPAEVPITEALPVEAPVTDGSTGEAPASLDLNPVE